MKTTASPQPKFRTPVAGFSLTETLVVVAILAIIAVIGIPSYRTTVLNNRLLAASTDLVTTLNLARSEAVKSGTRVTLCKSANATACDNSVEWERGWIVFTDEGTVGQIDAGDTVLQVHSALNNGLTLRSDPNYTNHLSYQGSGRTVGSGGASTGGWLRLCDSRGTANAYGISVSATGLVSSTLGGEPACP